MAWQLNAKILLELIKKFESGIENNDKNNVEETPTSKLVEATKTTKKLKKVAKKESKTQKEKNYKK